MNVIAQDGIIRRIAQMDGSVIKRRAAVRDLAALYRGTI
jgi:hypothetical protein